MADKNNSSRLLTIEYRSIGAIGARPCNARQHSALQINQIARSIAAFGFNVPILVDSNGTVVAGHGRLAAAKKLGLAAVPVVFLNDLSQAEAQAFTIADNRLTDNSRWDDKLLGEALRELAALDLDFSLETTGFSMGEIDMRIEALGTASTSDEADTLPTSAVGPPITRHGDIWQAGANRIRCGNALDPRAFGPLMQGERAMMAFTDPPYNVKIDGHVSGLGRIRHREFDMASGEMSGAEFTDFLTIATGHMAQHSADGSLHYVFMDWRHFRELLAAGESSFNKLLNVCIWTKHNAGMGSLYRSQYEAIFVFKAGRGAHRNNVQLGCHGRNRSNVWSYPGVNAFGLATDEGQLAALHPTVKPVRLIADAILDCTERSDVVLDPFLGSGSTLIACERTGRRCYALEIDPLYVDVAVRRWQSYCGESARHAETGQTFDEIAAARDRNG